MRLLAVFVVLVPLLVVGLVVGIVVGSAVTQDSVAGPNDVQRRLDEAASLQAADRETALRRFLLLREADGIVEEALAASPPQPEFAPFATPEAKAERAALIGAAAKDFAAFCEGREPRECLLAEAEELMATAPEVTKEAQWWGAIGPSETGRQIAIVLAEAGRFDDAIRIGKGIRAQRDRNRTMRDIVILMAESGQIERAAETIGDITQVARVSEAMSEIARLLVELREFETARKVLLRTAETVGRIENERERGQALVLVGNLYLQMGEVDAAQALIDQISDPYWRGYMKVFIAQKLAAVGDFAAAERLAAMVDEDEMQRAEAFRAVAVELAKIGDAGEARRVAERIEHPVNQVGALSAVARATDDAKSGTGDFATAKVLALGIEDAGDRADALAQLAGDLVKAGETEAADAIAAELIAMDGKLFEVGWGLKEIAAAFHDIGQRDAVLRYVLHAEEAASKLEDAEDRSGHFLANARLLIEVGDYAEAERIAARIEEPSSRVFAFKDLGIALAKAGQVTKATRIAALISEVEGAEEWLGSGLTDVAEGLAKAGESVRAEAIADRIPEQDQQRKAFTTIVKALVEDGQLVEAERISRRVEDGAWRAVALAALASRS